MSPLLIGGIILVIVIVIIAVVVMMRKKNEPDAAAASNNAVSTVPVAPEPPAPVVAIFCENEDPVNVSAPSGKTLRISSAMYGRTSNTTCPGPYGLGSAQVQNINCNKDLTSYFSKYNGLTSISESWPAIHSAADDPCQGTYKYLTLTYTVQ